MDDIPEKPAGAPLAPFSNPTFRAIWAASLVSNFGGLIQSVGAAMAVSRPSSSNRRRGSPPRRRR